MSQFKILEGREGEDIAAEFLKKNGYIIVDRNFRLRMGEIDIIAIEKKENTLVFIEVKTRESFKFGRPEDAITRGKIRSIVKVAQYYKAIKNNLPDLLRIDAVSVIMRNFGEPKIEHFKNITDFVNF